MSNSEAIEETTLTFEELSVLNARKAELKKDHEEYVNSHPELKSLLSSFMCAVLMEKPSDIYSFAKEHFSTLAPKQRATKLDPLVIAGPSGVGKGTLIKKLLDLFPNIFGFSVSHTSRGPRSGEEDGVAYHFKNKQEIEEEIKSNGFLEYANVHGNIYGTSKKAFEKVQQLGKVCVLDIDIQGVQQIKKSGIAANYLFVAPPSMEQLEKRLRGRGTETEEKVQLRLENASKEMEYSRLKGNFDKIIVNEDLETAFGEVIKTVKAWYPHIQ